MMVCELSVRVGDYEQVHLFRTTPEACTRSSALLLPKLYKQGSKSANRRFTFCCTSFYPLSHRTGVLCCSDGTSQPAKHTFRVVTGLPINQGSPEKRLCVDFWIWYGRTPRRWCRSGLFSSSLTAFARLGWNLLVRASHRMRRMIVRHKRAISDWFLSPNTKWCGKGHSASEYRQLGGASRADMCCRTHDHCKYMIPPMSTNFQTFNIRPFTISHCACDSRFRTCLKLADSKDANLVGKLFFNVMQMKCFVFKPETVCTKKSWWGTCERKGRRKRAVLRHNRKF